MSKILGVLFGFITFFVIILIAGFLIKIVFFPVKVLNNEIQTGYDIVDKTINANNAIYNYEWFKQTYEDIQAKKKQYDNACINYDEFLKSAGDRKDWTFEDKTEDSRLRSVKLGLQNSLEQIIADYNARTKMANRNIFVNGLLPNFIDATTFIFKN